MSQRTARRELNALSRLPREQRRSEGPRIRGTAFRLELNSLHPDDRRRVLGELERYRPRQRVAARQRERLERDYPHLAGRASPAQPRLRVAGLSGPDLERFARERLLPVAAATGEGELGAKALRLGRAVVVETPRAYIERPGKTLSGDFRFVRDTLAGIAGVPYQFVRDPEGTVRSLPGRAARLPKAVAEEYERRYGPAVEGDFDEFRRRVQEGGGLPIALDATVAGAAAAKGAGGLARLGALGPQARRAVTRPRARLRVAPGEVRRQRDESRKAAPNVIRLAAQRHRDRRREAAFGRGERRAAGRGREAKARGEFIPGTRRFTQPYGGKERVSVRELAGRQRRVADRVVAAGGRIRRDDRGRVEAVSFGVGQVPERVERSLERAGFEKRRTGREVVFFAPREVVSRRLVRERATQRRIPARLKGAAVNEIRDVKGEVRRDFDRAAGVPARVLRVRGLAEPERRALFWVGTGRLSPDNLEANRRILDRMEEAIVAERRGARPSRHQEDNLDLIRYLRHHADEAFTPRLRQAVDEIRRQVRRGERENPFLAPGQRVRARYGPPAVQFGVEPRREPVERFDVEASRKAWLRRQRDARPLDGEAVAAIQRRRAAGELTDDEAAVALRVLAEARASAEGVELPERLARPELRRTAEGDLVRADSDRMEGAAAFARRVREAQRAEGVDQAPFFAPSQELHTPKLTIYTAGGTRSPEPSRRREHVLQRRGVERTDPEVIFEGILRNHRTRITAQLVADVFDRTAHPRYRDLPAVELKRAIEREGFDPTQVAVWFPGLYRDGVRGRLVGQEEARRRGERPGEELEQAAFETTGEVPHLAEALRDATLVADSTADLARGLAAPRFQRQRGTLVPRAVHDEIMSATRGNNVVERGFERLKTMQSRAVLGAGNVAWVQADTIVNAGVAATLANVGPIRFVKSQLWYRKLPPEVKRWVDAELDIGASRSQVHKPQMGAAVNSRFVNWFRAWRESPWGRRVRPVQRSIDAFLQAERKLANNPARRAVLHQLARKEAFRQLDADVGALNGVMARLAHTFTLGPRQQMLALLRDRQTREELGRGVAEVLGDWTTFTALERRTIGRHLFFYPYLRYSLRLAFWTLPLDHPVRLAIVTNLAALTAREQRELVGATDDDAYLLAGRYFYRGDDGKLYEYNVRTLSPVGNALTEAEHSEDLLQLAPPFLTILLGQVMKRDIYRGREWRVQGSASRDELRDIGPLDGLLGTTRYRVLANDLLRLPVVTRELAKHLLPGEQGNDSLPFSARPTRFKDPRRQQQADAKRDRDERPLGRQLSESQLRFFDSRESDILDVLARRHRRSGSAPSELRRLNEELGIIEPRGESIGDLNRRLGIVAP